MKPFSISHQPHDGYDVLALTGELDAHTSSHLEESLKSLILQSRHRIIVNCLHLDYIASAGLGVFMAYIEEVRELGGDIKLTNMSERVFHVFDLLGFPTLYDILPEESEAAALFNEQR